MEAVKTTRVDHHLRHTGIAKVAAAPPAVNQNVHSEEWWAQTLQIVTDKRE
jgi:hypothetical protein